MKLALYLGTLVLLGAVGTWLHPALSGQAPGTAELEGAGWEGRRMVAQLLWARTHAVLHAGMEEREARRGEAEGRSEFHSHGSGGAPDQHDHAGHDEHEKGMVLVIPPAREDFRGVLGDLERQVKPYLGVQGQMYSKDANQTLPFYRLMTWADPHFIQGYVTGASFIADAGKRADEGLAFLHEGERYNPGSFEIQTELGHFYLVYKKDYPRAIRHLERALELVPHRDLNEVEAEEHLDLYRWLALAYTEGRHPERALALAWRGVKLFPGDVTLVGVIKRQGHPVR